MLRSDDLLAVQLLAFEPGFRFDAFLEFAHLGDYWKVPGATGSSLEAFVSDADASHCCRVRFVPANSWHA